VSGPLVVDQPYSLEVRTRENSNRVHIRGCCIGINLLGGPFAGGCSAAGYSEYIAERYHGFSEVLGEVADRMKLDVLSERIAITPAFLLPQSQTAQQVAALAGEIESCLLEVSSMTGRDAPLVGGFVANVARGTSRNNQSVIDAFPEILCRTDRACCCLNVADSQSGVNISGVRAAVSLLRSLGANEANQWRASRFITTANNPGATPYMPCSFHPADYGDIHVSVSIGMAPAILERLRSEEHSSIDQCMKSIVDVVLNAVRIGEKFASNVAKQVGASGHTVDISIAPSLEPESNSVGEILEQIGARCFGVGSTAALSILMNSLRRGGLAGSLNVGGLSGAFLPVSEDFRLIERAEAGDIGLEKLEAITNVCCVGLDMIGLNIQTSDDVLQGIMLDEMVVGVNHRKATAVRLILLDAAPGDVVDLTSFDPLFGKVVVLKAPGGDCRKLLLRSGSGRVVGPERFATH
jgi:uncharacterized protein (UPF0210 family)